MKKLGIFALAFALVLGLSQCKKESTNSTNDEGAKVPITLNVGGGNGSRVAVEGSTGVVTFEDGDVLYVASNGACVGTLTYNGENFAGEVTEPTEGQKLQFYFLGNKTPEFNADNTGCSVVISDQTEYLPVISYAPSRENYQIGKTDYNATLLNKCALVKFDVTTASEAATCIVGMNNKVTVNFTDNSFEYVQDGEGVITLAAGNGEKWAILLPQDGIAHANAYSEDEIYVGSCGTLPAIAENDYLTTGIAVAISLPSGAVDGLFTINSNGDQVYFSKGNLQYIGSAATPYWKFADHQWDYFGTTTGQNSSNENVDRDLFGWGTSGYHDASDPYNLNYHPWSTSNDWVNINYNVFGYGPATNMIDPNLIGTSANYDWGVYNSISNGGNTENSGWRTLTQSEWEYVFYLRMTASGIRWVKGIVNGVKGIIHLPDNWIASTYALNSSNGGEYVNNIITAEDWTNVLEANGAVFLPAAGNRWINSVGYLGNTGFYWSASNCGAEWAYAMFFDSGSTSPTYGNRHIGYSVRLVRNVE